MLSAIAATAPTTRMKQMYLAAAAAAAKAADSYASNGAVRKQRVLQRRITLLTGLTGTATKAATKGAATIAKPGSRIVCAIK